MEDKKTRPYHIRCVVSAVKGQEQDLNNSREIPAKTTAHLNDNAIVFLHTHKYLCNRNQEKIRCGSYGEKILILSREDANLRRRRYGSYLRVL